MKFIDFNLIPEDSLPEDFTEVNMRSAAHSDVARELTAPAVCAA